MSGRPYGVLLCHVPVVSVSAQTDFFSPDKEVQERIRQSFQVDSSECSRSDEALRFWSDPANLRQWVRVGHVTLGQILTMDESKLGWGAVLGELECSGLCGVRASPFSMSISWKPRQFFLLYSPSNRASMKKLSWFRQTT